MKKSILLLAVLMMMFTFVLCACEDKKEENPTPDIVVDNGEELNEEYYEEENKILDPADLDKLVVSLGEGSLKMDDKFEEVKAGFGAEAKPAQSYTPCGGSDDAQMTTHYYDGLEIEETCDGIVCHAKVSGYDFPESQASIAGIKLGDTPDKVRAMFGSTPDTDSEYTINYTFGSIILSYSLDFEGNGTVNYMSIDDMNLAGA